MEKLLSSVDWLIPVGCLLSVCLFVDKVGDVNAISRRVEVASPVTRVVVVARLGIGVIERVFSGTLRRQFAMSSSVTLILSVLSTLGVIYIYSFSFEPLIVSSVIAFSFLSSVLPDFLSVVETKAVSRWLSGVDAARSPVYRVVLVCALVLLVDVVATLATQVVSLFVFYGILNVSGVFAGFCRALDGGARERDVLTLAVVQVSAIVVTGFGASFVLWVSAASSLVVGVLSTINREWTCRVVAWVDSSKFPMTCAWCVSLPVTIPISAVAVYWFRAAVII